MNSGTKTLLLVTLCCVMVACSTVTVDFKKATAPLSKEPTFVDYRDYYFWGILPSEHHLNLSAACLDQEPVRAQTYFGFEDFLLGFFTLGIYFPKTLAVWCESPSSARIQQ